MAYMVHSMISLLILLTVWHAGGNPQIHAHSVVGTRTVYLGPALQHYRPYKTYSIPTHSIVISDTVAWLIPDKFIMPGSSLQDRALAALEDLHNTLRDCANKQPRPLDLVDACTTSLHAPTLSSIGYWYINLLYSIMID
jgi:hypothetical protein